MGSVGTNGAEVRGSTCGFPAIGENFKGKEAEGWVLAKDDGKERTPGSVVTTA